MGLINFDASHIICFVLFTLLLHRKVSILHFLYICTHIIGRKHPSEVLQLSQLLSGSFHNSALEYLSVALINLFCKIFFSFNRSCFLYLIYVDAIYHHSTHLKKISSRLPITINGNELYLLRRKNLSLITS